MKVNIKNFDKYQHEKQERIKYTLKEIIHDMFIATADHDYLCARWSVFSGLHRHFFWSALQTLEKYFKAHLLFCKEPVKDYDHKIVNLYDKLKEKNDFLSSVTLNPPDAFQELVTEISWGPNDVYSFITEIDKYGNSSNRYDFFGTNYDFSYLFKLDALAYLLRSKLTELTDIPFLYKNKHFDKIKYFVYEQNYYFAPNDYKHNNIYANNLLTIRSSVPAVEMALKGNRGDQQIYEKWITCNVKIKNEEIKKIKNPSRNY